MSVDFSTNKDNGSMGSRIIGMGNNVLKLKRVDKSLDESIFRQPPSLACQGIEQIVIKKHASKLRSNDQVYRFRE